LNKQNPNTRVSAPSEHLDNISERSVHDSQPGEAGTVSSDIPTWQHVSLLNELSGTRAKRRPASTGRCEPEERAAKAQGPTSANEHASWPRRSARVDSANRAELPDQNNAPTGPQHASLSGDQNLQSLALEGWEIEVLGTFRKAFEVVGHVDSPAYSEIVSGINNMYRQIADSAGALTQSQHRQTVQYLPLASDETFIELGQILFAGQGTSDLIQKLSATHVVHGMPLKEIIRAFTAVALTRWPQKVLEEYRVQWSFSSQGPFGQRMLHGMFCS
jgi:hypothetical protein